MLIAAIQPVLIRLVPTKGSKVCFWHLWVGPVLSSKQEESWERTKRIVSTTAVQSLTLFWTHLIVGHLFTWQQPKHKVLPTTKSCDILDVTMTGLVWANTHSNKTWVLHIPLLCFHYIVIQNDGTLKFLKLETTKNEAKFGYVLLWNDCPNPRPTS